MAYTGVSHFFFDKMSRRKWRITHTSHSGVNTRFPSFSLFSWLRFLKKTHKDKKLVKLHAC